MPKKKFVPGEDLVHYAGDVIDDKEAFAIVKAVLDGRFALGDKAKEFELALSKLIECKESFLVNSGSSANLIAVTALGDKLLKDSRGPLKRGDGIITSALGFPTSVSPIIQNGFVPVLVDSRLGSYTMSVEEIEGAVSGKTRALLVPHVFGSVNDMYSIMKIAEDHSLYVIEDSCDTIGSFYRGRSVGSFGDLSTFSFYPPHIISIGEGGVVGVNNAFFSDLILSLREWGRYPQGADFSVFTDDPVLYDRRYMYVTLGYNSKPTEILSAMGIHQLDKLPCFIDRRNHNFKVLYDFLSRFEDFFILPESLPGARNVWYSFPITIRKGAPFCRKDIVKFLEDNKIETRPLFSGNVIRQPAFRDFDYLKKRWGVRPVVYGSLENASFAMENSFFVGIYPGITDEMLDYMCCVFEKFLRKFG